MSKQNVRQSVAQQLSNRGDAVQNHEGGLAFRMPAVTRLMTKLFASLAGEKMFYTDGETADAELVSCVQEAAAENPEMVLRLAAFARQEMNIRSTPIVVLGEAAALPAFKSNGLIRDWTPQIVRRADEPAEVMAYWIKRHGSIGSGGERGGEHAFPKGLSRGLGDTLRRFDEYQFAKYDRDGSVKLRDVLRVVRPHPRTDAESALYQYLVKGVVNEQYLPKLAAKAKLLRKEHLDAEAFELAAQAHVTWEVLSSKFGRSAATWNALAGQLPIMAGIRNLSNIMEVNADEALTRVVSMLRNRAQVKRSRQLPYRYFSAYRALEGRIAVSHPRRGEVLVALQEALEFSVDNLPRLTGRSFITTDNSGSMGATVSEKSTVTRQEVGNLLGAMAHTMCESAIVSVFGESHRVVPVNSKDSILTNMDRLNKTDVGHSTYAHLAIRYLRETKTWVDRVIVFSDMQCYGEHSLAEELRLYRSSVNPNVHLVSVDLAGYGTSQFPVDEPNVTLLAGWSDRVLELIALREQGASKVLEMIAAWQPYGEKTVPEVSSETDDGPDV